MTDGGVLEPVELSDLIIDYDPETLERRPVSRSAVLDRLRASNQHGAARIAARIPHDGDALDPRACDAILYRAHCELQRLSEEFQQGERVRALLVPILGALRAAGVEPPYRVVDIGAGLGFVVRWLAARGGLGDDVELVGCDYDAALLDRATECARAESLRCTFLRANAFRLEPPAHVYLSTGVVHHFRGADLTRFFEGQRDAYAFAHFDIQPSPVAGLGAWIFHVSRMREPLARHDGVLSALRSHPADRLLEHARRGAQLPCAQHDAGRTPLGWILRPMHAVVGARALLHDTLAAHAPLRARLGAFA